MKSGSGRSVYRVITTLIAMLMMVGMMGGAISAQESTTIESTQRGEMPTSGGARPGPSTGVTAQAEVREGVVPVAISIERAGVEAAVEVREIVDGVMQDPTGPWVVSWYQETPKLGADGNTVMAGHVDYWDVGPAVFYNVGGLQENDLITVSGEDGRVYTYKVQWVRVYDTANAPIQDIVGPTDQRALTLITCGGEFDYQNGVYLSRTVVRALYVGSETPA
jgi:sortase (surface protein transpeptidase)